MGITLWCLVLLYVCLNKGTQKKQPPGKIIIKKVANKFHRASQVVLQVQPGSSQGLAAVSRLVVFSFPQPRSDWFFHVSAKSSILSAVSHLVGIQHLPLLQDDGSQGNTEQPTLPEGLIKEAMLVLKIFSK